MNGQDISSCFLCTSLRGWRTSLTGPNTGQRISESQPNLLEFFEIGESQISTGFKAPRIVLRNLSQNKNFSHLFAFNTSLGHWIAFCILSLCLLRLAKDMGKPRWSRPASFRRQWRVSAIKVSSKTGPRWVFEHLKSCRYGDPFLARLRLIFIRWIQDVFSSLQVSHTKNFEFIVIEDVPICSTWGFSWLPRSTRALVAESTTWIWHPEIQPESLSPSLVLSFFLSFFLSHSLFLSSILFSFSSLSLSFSPSLYIILSISCQCVFGFKKNFIEELFHDPGST